ncbi:MAG: uroporphyrinogen-III C-methyltransferase [Marmoricola sp.]|nr:uroporphyrinogen-III C-methyltransferase [Marmoricola sp.]
MSSQIPDLPTYPVGLRLADRRVLVVGGGSVAQRRVPGLIAAGAVVDLVAPHVTPAIEGLVGSGEVRWHQRGFEDTDVDGAWYVLAATDDPAINTRVGQVAEEQRVFCVRADDAAASSAFTPATGSHAGATVAVLGSSPSDRDPRRHARLRDEIVDGLRDGSLGLAVPGPTDEGHDTDEVDALREPGRRTSGRVVLVGGGPGDPELISVAGRKALMAADVVVADRLAPRELLGDLPADTEIVDVAKLPRGRSAQQDEINRIIVERALAGAQVVRFKGGDSFVFGRGYEEVEACRAAGVPVTVVPGISSPLAVPAVAGIPVTHRGVTHDLTVVSGHLPPGHPGSLVRWEALAGLRGTLVLMMAVENAPRIAAALLAGGRPAGTPVAVVCDGTMPTQRTVLSTLGGLAEALEREAVQPPAIIVVGHVVAVAHPEAFTAPSSPRQDGSGSTADDQ